MTNACMSSYNMNGQRGNKRFKLLEKVVTFIERKYYVITLFFDGVSVCL